jgi:hypothetical protein
MPLVFEPTSHREQSAMTVPVIFAVYNCVDSRIYLGVVVWISVGAIRQSEIVNEMPKPNINVSVSFKSKASAQADKHLKKGATTAPPVGLERNTLLFHPFLAERAAVLGSIVVIWNQIDKRDVIELTKQVPICVGSVLILDVTDLAVQPG